MDRIQRQATGRMLYVACVLTLLATLSPLFAQTGRWTVSGQVTDRSGGIVPGATVQIVETATNRTYELLTNNLGLYTAPNMPSGTYKVVVSKAGFASMVRQPVLMSAEVEIRVDITLEPGTVQQSVTIDAAAPLLDVSTTGNSTELTVIGRLLYLYSCSQAAHRLGIRMTLPM